MSQYHDNLACPECRASLEGQIGPLPPIGPRKRPDLTEEQEALWWAIAELPTVLHNRISDGSRDPLVIALGEAIKRQGYRLVKESHA